MTNQLIETNFFKFFILINALKKQTGDTSILAKEKLFSLERFFVRMPADSNFLSEIKN